MEKTQKKSPRRNQISHEVLEAIRQVVHKEIEPLRKQLEYLMGKDHDGKVIDSWLEKHPQHKSKAEGNKEQWLNRELIKALLYALTIIGALVGAKLWQ
jgi:Ni,Fe-hydrogenase III component G